MIRHMKILAAMFIGLFGLSVFLGNLLNIESAHWFVSFVVSGTEQPHYKVIGPVITAGWLHWVILIIIMACELTIGLLGLAGAVKMFKHRNSEEEVFTEAKHLAILAGAMGMLVWFGFFIVIGEGYFHMWQYEAGLGPIQGSFRYGGVCALLMFFISMKND